MNYIFGFKNRGQKSWINKMDQNAFKPFYLEMYLILAFGILSLFVNFFRYVQNSLAGKKLSTQVSHVIVD